MRLCVNCKHCLQHEATYSCMRRMKLEASLVHGRLVREDDSPDLPCQYERHSGEVMPSPWPRDRCGPEGKYFEEKAVYVTIYKYGQDEVKPSVFSWLKSLFTRRK